MKRLLLALLLAPMVAAAQPSTVILVRHAEKADNSADPVLSEAGNQRAKDLAVALADAGVGSVITTNLQRTRLTAAGVLEATKLTPIVVPATGPNHAAAVAAAVQARPAGEVVLVVGHSNTVTAIIAALGGPKMGNICDSQYSNIYIMQMGPTPRLVRANFGKADPADPACTNTMR